MYTSRGYVVNKYKEAVDEMGFRLYWGEDATAQSPDMGDVLLHETAVAWFRKRMYKERPSTPPWLETPQAWDRRARRVVQHINDNFDVISLCRQFPQRLHAVVESEGERLRK